MELTGILLGNTYLAGKNPEFPSYSKPRPHRQLSFNWVTNSLLSDATNNYKFVNSSVSLGWCPQAIIFLLAP